MRLRRLGTRAAWPLAVVGWITVGVIVWRHHTREVAPSWVREDLVPASVYLAWTRSRPVPKDVQKLFPFVGLRAGDVIAFEDCEGRTRLVKIWSVLLSAEREHLVRQGRGELWDRIDLARKDPPWYEQHLAVFPSARAFVNEAEAMAALERNEPAFSDELVWRVPSRGYPRHACKVVWPPGRDDVLRTPAIVERRLWPSVPTAQWGGTP